MNERNLSRGLSTSVVDALKAHGHILVVKGGAAALARELDEIIAPALAVIEPHIEPRGPMSDEPTSTFGSDAIDQAVEELVARLARALMSSDHVEDVFAEDGVIRRDIFRTVQAGLLTPAAHLGEDRTTVTVKLDTLGYVAATVSKRADAATLRQALDRAAAVTHARFTAYSPELREATFRIDGGGDDERLDLEEAVADELADLAEQGVTPLPTLERRIDVGRALAPAEQRAARPRIDAAAEATLLRSGYAATWDFADARTVRVTFTPLSDQDAHGVDAPAAAFGREIGGIVGAGKPPAEPEAARPAMLEAPPVAPEPEPEPEEETKAPRRKVTKTKEPSAPAQAPKRAAKEAAETPAPKRTKRAAEPAPSVEEAPAPKRKRAAEAPPSAAKSSSPSRRETAKAAAPRSSAKRTAAKSKTTAKKG
ncbi:Cytoplasmic axial filament protein CafA and Ribonuclease G [Minicystis rosea]|nr:Cytoplasmic axial filament protein CafA and Ribonuclease G [Minicystis rosea]